MWLYSSVQGFLAGLLVDYNNYIPLKEKGSTAAKLLPIH
jgi:hypothetical protein